MRYLVKVEMLVEVDSPFSEYQGDEEGENTAFDTVTQMMDEYTNMGYLKGSVIKEIMQTRRKTLS